MNKKKIQKTENQSSIYTNEFLNFKKEITEELDELRKKIKKVDEKYEQISQNILDIQTKQFTEILNEIKNMPMNRKKKLVTIKQIIHKILHLQIMIIKLIIKNPKKKKKNITKLEIQMILKKNKIY